ncbi:MAG: hypothetical protein JWP69_322 [Flaviaesturariibacter sp.]|nr:hypothetical protein [Flaviaesturariibacter sp.]
MKNLPTGILCIVFSFLCFFASAQKEDLINEPDYNKPKLFADLPQKFDVNIPALETLLDLPEGQPVNIPLTQNKRYQGVVVSKSNPADPSVKSIVINSTNKQGATFTFTRIRNEDGSFEYIGRIISYKNSDAFELVKEGASYRLVKRHLYDLFNE